MVFFSRPYLDEDDRNDVIYRCRGEEAESRLQRTINEAVALQKALEDAELTDKEEYALLCRALQDQTNAGEKHQRIPRDRKDIRSDSLG